MARVGFAMALPKGRNPSELPNVETARMHGDVWGMRVDGIGEFYVNVVRKNMSLPTASIGMGGLWTVILVYPIGQDWKEATRSFRAFRRYGDANPTRVQGPVSLARAKELGIIAGIDWVIAGDSVAGLEAIDYRPTQAEVDDDTEADLRSLSPA